jgi:repressor LexA
MALTKRQYEVLELLDSFINKHGYSPSFAEIKGSLQLSSLATIHKHIHSLQKKGFLRIGRNQSRSIEILNRDPLQKAKEGIHKPNTAAALSKPGQDIYLEIPLLGLIAAGKPLEAIQHNESLSLKEFAGRPEIFLLKVTGDSMIDDHICDGDYVMVEKTNSANNGETVVALLHNSDATLKKLFREKDHRVRLQPANAAMAPIVVEESAVHIQGRVIAILRKY